MQKTATVSLFFEGPETAQLVQVTHTAQEMGGGVTYTSYLGTANESRKGKLQVTFDGDMEQALINAMQLHRAAQGL